METYDESKEISLENLQRIERDILNHNATIEYHFIYNKIKELNNELTEEEIEALREYWERKKQEELKDAEEIRKREEMNRFESEKIEIQILIIIIEILIMLLREKDNSEELTIEKLIESLRELIKEEIEINKEDAER